MQELFRDQIPDSLSSTLRMLRKVRINLRTMDERETVALDWLVQSSPALEILELRIREEDLETSKYMAFVEKLVSFVTVSTQVTMCHGIIGANQYNF